MAGLTFSIRKRQLKKALMDKMTLKEDGTVACGAGEGPFSCVLAPLDSGVEDCPWGRLRLQLMLPVNCVCYLYAAAGNEAQWGECLMDPKLPFAKKRQYFNENRCLRFINKEDVLLYEITGRYLWIAVEMIGEGAAFSDVDVYVPGDTFMEVFPEIYREKNSFFHRYLSIYSSIYNDFQDVLDHREDLPDINKASKNLLEMFLKWIGVDVEGGFWEEEFLRTLLRETPELIRCKGTGKCIRRICSLFLGEEPVILERRLMQRYVRSAQQEVYDSLYGDSPYDVTLMLSSVVDERKKEQLLHLLEQFKPVRCRLHILFLEKRSELDRYTYLDRNAVVFSQEAGSMDFTTLVDGAVVLQ